MHKLGAVLPSRHLLLLLVDPHRHAASRAKQKHLNTNNNNNHPKQSFSLGFSTLREKFFFKLRSRFLISQEKLFCVLENVLPYINLPLGPNRISKTEERPKATEKKDLSIFFWIKVGHLLSEFAIEFTSELCCRILLSKVTNKLSKSWCRMWIKSEFRQ